MITINNNASHLNIFMRFLASYNGKMPVFLIEECESSFIIHSEDDEFILDLTEAINEL